MSKNLLARLGVRRRQPQFTAEQLLETFQHGYRAGQADGPAKPVAPRPLGDICAEYLAELDALATVVPMGAQR